MPNTTQRLFTILGMFLAVMATGCGTTQQRTATEQLVLSDAVDKSIAQIDFRLLAGKTVYFDTTYLRPIKADSFVNADYVISSLRQQMMAANCYLQDTRETAEIIVEARVGTMATNRHEIVYGIPQSNALSTAASALASQPILPPLPELSVARSDSMVGMSKVAVFAYDQETKEPIWQSGTSRSESNAKSTWLLGAGPFQKGSIYKGYRFAGQDLTTPKALDASHPPVNFAAEHYFGAGSNSRMSSASEESLGDSPAKR